ncbi:hypothetical protein DM01DRAFT_166901 [Hesseltinella vesiculosa]|uniref:Uncharacterized protein n=1 Tax=Hesseltinella vesiculosa TaxID=101127 RepID=A0A1X2GW23_9FUNG|nr:hypothetical protein DM01DRAFT_166901 [Hesseltinella vesiculosa]
MVLVRLLCELQLISFMLFFRSFGVASRFWWPDWSQEQVYTVENGQVLHRHLTDITHSRSATASLSRAGHVLQDGIVHWLPEFPKLPLLMSDEYWTYWTSWMGYFVLQRDKFLIKRAWCHGSQSLPLDRFCLNEDVE